MPCLVLLLVLFLCPSPVQAISDDPAQNAGPGVEPAKADKSMEQAAPMSAPVMISSSSQSERETEAPAALLSEGATPTAGGQARAPITEQEVTSNPAAPAQKLSNEYGNVTEEVAGSGEGPQIADPIEPWNRAMYNVNDKLYFWVIKPAATGYTHALPEDVRNMFSNLYQNIKAPVRIVNNLLQGKPEYAGIELTRFIINSVIGVGGLKDCARECFGINGRSADFGQTLGRYGVGFGFYIVWPVLGPSSPRDTVGLVADRFLTPQTYISSESISPEGLGLSVHEMINNASFHLGDYEALKGAAIDPYIAMRDAYVQHRKKMLEQ